MLSEPGAQRSVRDSTQLNIQSLRCGALERLPKWLICIPLGFQWVWLALRYRGTTLPSCVNPHITAGGLVGEGKLEYFESMGPLARANTAPYIGVVANQNLSRQQLIQSMATAQLTFPIIAKPDLGLCGFGVCRIDSLEQLWQYSVCYPRGETIVLQSYLSEPGEAGIFYHRDPVTDQSQIIGMALRHFPSVVGDGRHTLAELIANDPRAVRLLGDSRHRSNFDLRHIPSAGESVRLATVGSIRVGGLYRDGQAHITKKLLNAIDAIARDMPAFYCGRFDVRFEHLHELSGGFGFRIIEINGAGSEAIHAWDPEISLFRGIRIIFKKQKILFLTGAALRRQGVQPIKLSHLAGLYLRQRRLIQQYPPSN